MTGKRFARLAAAVAVCLLVLAAFVVQLLGGKGSVPGWQQLRAALGVPLQTEESAPQTADGSTVVYVLDVGQGDAVLLCQDGAYCLIDTGPVEAEDALLYDLDVLGVPSLDYLVLTHPHADHTGNARAVLRALPVKTLPLPLWQPTADETAISQSWPPTAEQKFSQQKLGKNSRLAAASCKFCRAAARMPTASTMPHSARCSRRAISAFSIPATQRQKPSSAWSIPTARLCMPLFSRQGITGPTPPTA